MKGDENFKLADECFQNNQPEEARQHYGDLFNTDPTGYALFRYGILLQNKTPGVQCVLPGYPNLAAEYFRKALSLLKKSAAFSHALSCATLGQIYDTLDFEGVVQKNFVIAAKYYKIAAKQGNSVAQFNLARLYDRGEKNFPMDKSKAVKWYRLAAEQGIPLAQYYLSIRYYHGKGVEKDWKESAKWMRKAALQNLRDAEFGFGSMLFYGEGVDLNRTGSVMWYYAAAQKGHLNAILHLAWMYSKGERSSK